MERIFLKVTFPSYHDESMAGAGLQKEDHKRNIPKRLLLCLHLQSPVSDILSDFELVRFSCISDNALSIKLDTYT